MLFMLLVAFTNLVHAHLGGNARAAEVEEPDTIDGNDTGDDTGI